MMDPIICINNKCIYSEYLDPIQHLYLTNKYNGAIIMKDDKIHLPRYIIK